MASFLIENAMFNILPGFPILAFPILRVVKTQAILFLKSMSDRSGFDSI